MAARSLSLAPAALLMAATLLAPGCNALDILRPKTDGKPWSRTYYLPPGAYSLAAAGATCYALSAQGRLFTLSNGNILPPIDPKGALTPPVLAIDKAFFAASVADRLVRLEGGGEAEIKLGEGRKPALLASYQGKPIVQLQGVSDKVLRIDGESVQEIPLKLSRPQLQSLFGNDSLLWAQSLSSGSLDVSAEGIADLGTSGKLDLGTSGDGYQVGVDSEGHFLVLKSQRLAWYASDGRLVQERTLPGATMMAIDTDGVWVMTSGATASSSQARLNKYANSGDFLGAYSLPAPGPIAIGASSVWVVESGDIIQEFGKTPALVTSN
jgi:hypothetical protein